MKKTIAIIAALAALSLIGCGSTTPAIAVASVGIAGAALSVYCSSGGSGCSPALTAYASLIVTQAGADAAILESGSSTMVQIQVVVTSLQSALATGQQLPGLTVKQQAEVSAITAATSLALTLIAPLLESSPAPNPVSRSIISAGKTTVTFQLTTKDHAAIARMREKIAAVK